MKQPNRKASRHPKSAARVHVGIRIGSVLKHSDSPARIRQVIRSALQNAARAVIASTQSVSVDVLVTGDAEIRRLNADYRHNDRATDCLSFPQLNPAEARELWAIDPPRCFVARKPARTSPRNARLSPAPLAVAPGPIPLGDIVLCLPAIQRQAARQRVALDTELRFVAVHSLLHLLGCDHNTPLLRRAMWTLNQALVSNES